jgi:hypothetical protein
MTLRVIKSSSKSDNQIYTGPHYQIAYQACWNNRLINPVLNRLYKESVCYTERWYLELRKMVLEEEWYHPLLNSVVNDIELRKKLVKSTVIDGTLMRSVMNDEDFPEYHISAGINLKKINRWCAFFISLPDSLETLADLNGQSRD